jgi:hypothetical protein
MQESSRAAAEAARFRVPFSESRWTAVTIVRVGSNNKYSEGWEGAFGKRKSAVATTAAKPGKKAAKKKAASTKKKSAGKKKSKK